MGTHPLCGESHQHLRQHSILAIYDKVSNPSTLSASSPEFQSLMQQMPLMTAGVILGLIGLLFYPATILQSQFGRIDPLRAITRRQLQGSLWSPSAKVVKPWKGFRSNRLVLDLTLIGWYFLNYFTRDVIGFYTMPYFINCQIAFYDQIQADQTRAAPFYRPSKP